MFSVTSTVIQRSSAKAFSTILLGAVAFGFAPVGANAADVDVEGTIDGCVVSISEIGPVDLGTPTLQSDGQSSPVYEFEATDSLSVMWETTNVGDCAGSLYAEHAGVTKTVGETTTASEASLQIGTDLASLVLLSALATEVDTSLGGGSGDMSYFDVVLTVDPSEGPGDYSSTITFTVVIE